MVDKEEEDTDTSQAIVLHEVFTIIWFPSA